MSDNGQSLIPTPDAKGTPFGAQQPQVARFLLPQ